MSSVGLEFVTSNEPDSAVGEFLDRNRTELYAVAFEIVDLDRLETQGVEPVGEVHLEEFHELFYHPGRFKDVLVV